jgi:hypothetical protein
VTSIIAVFEGACRAFYYHTFDNGQAFTAGRLGAAGAATIDSLGLGHVRIGLNSPIDERFVKSFANADIHESHFSRKIIAQPLNRYLG